MEINRILKKLEELGEQEQKDFFLEFHTDFSNMIKIIDKENFFIHSTNFEELEDNVNELIEKGLRQFILDNNTGSYKVHISDDDFEKLK